MYKKVVCKPGKEKVLYSRNSWLYTGAVLHHNNAKPGDIVRIYTHNGMPAAYGFYYGGKNIAVYLFEFTGDEVDVESEEYCMAR